MERGFLSSNGGRRMRGVKEKQHASVEALGGGNDRVDEAKNGTSGLHMVPNTLGANYGKYKNVRGATDKLLNEAPINSGLAQRNSCGESLEVVKDGMDSGCVDPKVVEGVNEPMSTIPKSFVSLVTNEVATSKDMVIAIPNLKDDGEFFHMVRVEYKWEPPSCGVCMVFGHDDMLCPTRPIEKPKKQHTNHDGFQQPSSSHGTNVGYKFQVKPKKPIWQVVTKNNSVSSSGTKTNSDVSRKVMSSTYLFDALNTIEEGDELGSNSSSYNVVSEKVDDLVNEDNDSKVEDVYDETATFIVSTSFNVNKASKTGSGGRNKILYEQWQESHDEDPYDDDDFDDHGLTHAQMKFANAFDINLRCQLR
ncbi:hypothetical protein Tco_0687517 [Tanacetum coccineum]